MTEFYWIITMQWTGPNGANNVATEGGTIDAAGRTRQQMFELIFAEMTTKHGAPRAHTSVLFFTLERNKIGVSGVGT